MNLYVFKNLDNGTYAVMWRQWPTDRSQALHYVTENAARQEFVPSVSGNVAIVRVIYDELTNETREEILK